MENQTVVVLIVGLLLFTGVHLIPVLAPSLKRKWIDGLGIKRYAGTFALTVLVSIVIIVLGWRSTTPTLLYFLPPIVQAMAFFLIVLAFALFVAASNPTRIRQFVRHPQLTGVVCWAVAHLLLNGDSRGVLLFGWIGTWALIEIALISRRDGQWIKHEPPERKLEAKIVAKTFIAVTVIALAHPLFTGMHAIPYLEAMFHAAFSN